MTDRIGAEKVSPTYQDLERAVADVPGVAEATVGAIEGTDRGRLKIRLDPGHDPDVVSQEVSRTLRERFGIHIDPAAIRPRPADGPDEPAAEAGAPPQPVAPPEPEPVAPPESQPEPVAPPEPEPEREPEPEPASEPEPQPAASSAPERAEREAAAGNGHSQRPPRHLTRPAIADLMLATAGLELHAEAVLELGGHQLRGRATGAATRKATFRTVAEATLAALEELFPGRLKIELEGLEIADDGEDERVTVTVTFLTEQGAEKLVGVAIARGDVERATMRATLDAVNRRVGRMLLAPTVTAD